MKKKMILFSAAALLLLGFCSIAFAGNRFFNSCYIVDNDGIFTPKITCWSAGSNKEGCTDFFVECSTCKKTPGTYDPSSVGECRP